MSHKKRIDAISVFQAVAVMIIIILAIFLVIVLAQSQMRTTTTVPFRTISTESTIRSVSSSTSSLAWFCSYSSLHDIPHQINASIAPYDDQVVMNFGGSYTSLAFNVTAVQYTDNYGYGPGYLLNGLSDKHYWYQIGIAYDWPSGTSPFPGFEFLFQEWNSSNIRIHQESIRAYTGSYVREGDGILLKINFSGNTIETYAKDWSTNSSILLSYPAMNATQFVPYLGIKNTSFTTGLMAEWYHVNPYQCSRPSNIFVSQTNEVTNSSISIDEWNYTGLPLKDWSTFNATLLFENWTPYSGNQSSSFRNFAYAVANVSNNDNEFILRTN